LSADIFGWFPLNKQQITVRVPATTSNLGPGFDCLGIALRIYNYVTVTQGEDGRTVPMARSAARKFFTTLRREPFPFSCTVEGEVPRARGLGSSVTVRLGVLHALNTWLGRPMHRTEIFALCAELEGHPDNAAPAEFGGFVATRGMTPQNFPVGARLRFVLLIPDFEVQTREARSILPNEIDRVRAAESCANACAITAAMASANYQGLRGAFGDHLHQPFRAKFVPFLDRVISAGEGAGALGGFLSGSGSTIICPTLRNARKVAEAMAQASGLREPETRITTADNEGVRIAVSILNPDAALA
jgi:homoserine kinase